MRWLRMRWPWSIARQLERQADQHREALEAAVMEARAWGARYAVDRLLKANGSHGRYGLRYARTDRNKIEQVVREAINGAPVNHDVSQDLGHALERGA